MIMTARQQQPSSPHIASGAISSATWAAELKAEVKNPEVADPSVFEDADEDVELNIPSTESSVTQPKPYSLTSSAAISSTTGAALSHSLFARSTESGPLPSDWLQKNLSASLNGRSSPVLSATTKSASSIEFLKKSGLLEGSMSHSAAQSLLQASLGLSSLSGSFPVASLTTTSSATPAAVAAPTPAKKAPMPPAKSVIEDEAIIENDVLSGRGGKSNHHSGNKRYRQVVAEMKQKYRGTSTKTDKTALSRAIVDYVNGYGGRFLKKDSKLGKYVVMTKAEARKKTSQALRETKVLKWTLNENK